MYTGTDEGILDGGKESSMEDPYHEAYGLISSYYGCTGGGARLGRNASSAPELSRLHVAIGIQDLDEALRQKSPDGGSSS